MTRVLCFSLSQLDGEACNALYARASQSRRAKADAFRREVDKRRCLVGEALLRFSLGGADVTLLTGEFGKPCLKDQPEVHFNISHSGSWVVLALSDRAVGIDIEQLRMDPGKEKLARRFFTETEQAWIFQDDNARGPRFFQIWTAKESFLKYLGTGLSKPLQSFDVLSMDFPRFFTQTLEDCILTLCTEEDGFELEMVSWDMLLSQ